SRIGIAAPDPAEHRPPDEGGDEPTAMARVGDAEGTDRSNHGNDLDPWCFDPVALPRRPQCVARDPTGDDTAENPPADRLEDELRCVARGDLARISLRHRQRDREEGHAQAVVETALDVQALTYTRRQFLVGN